LPPDVLKRAKDNFMKGADAEISLLRLKAGLWDNVAQNLTETTYHKRGTVPDGARAFALALAQTPIGSNKPEGRTRHCPPVHTLLYHTLPNHAQCLLQC
jgi:hypothetical protein